MDKQQEIILKADGSAVLRTIDEQPVQVVDEIAAELSKNVQLTVRNVGHTDKNLVLHMVVSSKESYIGAFLPQLAITAPWSMVENQLVMQVPGRGEVSQHPIMTLDWRVPSGMALLFLCRLSDGNTVTTPKHSCYLISYDLDQKGYYLPLPNIYEDASLCMGDFSGVADSARNAYQKALNQLANAQWNADLLGGRLPDIQAMFRLKPVKKGGKDVFENVDCGDWKQYCKPCETPVVAVGRRLL